MTNLARPNDIPQRHGDPTPEGRDVLVLDAETLDLVAVERRDLGSSVQPRWAVAADTG